MELKPVVNAAKPKYPDKYEIDVDKTLLSHRPKSWILKPIIGLTLSAIMGAGLAGFDCSWGVVDGNEIPPPIIHLSDNDALAIIADELEKSNLLFVTSNSRADIGFNFDGSIQDNTNNKLADLEYVSKKDCDDKKYPELTYPYCDSSNIAIQLKAAYPDAAIFYDPMTDWEPYSEELIRAQVLDFIEWLMAVSNE